MIKTSDQWRREDRYFRDAPLDVRLTDFCNVVFAGIVAFLVVGVASAVIYAGFHNGNRSEHEVNNTNNFWRIVAGEETPTGDDLEGYERFALDLREEPIRRLTPTDWETTAHTGLDPSVEPAPIESVVIENDTYGQLIDQLAVPVFGHEYKDLPGPGSLDTDFVLQVRQARLEGSDGLIQDIPSDNLGMRYYLMLYVFIISIFVFIASRVDKTYAHKWDKASDLSFSLNRTAWPQKLFLLIVAPWIFIWFQLLVPFKLIAAPFKAVGGLRSKSRKPAPEIPIVDTTKEQLVATITRLQALPSTPTVRKAIMSYKEALYEVERLPSVKELEADMTASAAVELLPAIVDPALARKAAWEEIDKIR